MSKAASGGQALQAVGALSIDTPWGGVDGDILQSFLELPPKKRGERFASFFNNGGCLQPVVGDFLRETGEVTIEIPALKRPTLKALQAKCGWIKSIERDFSTEEPITMTLASVLSLDQKEPICSKEYERRLTPHANRLLGFQHREWFLEHQDEFPALKPLFRKIHIDFPGLTLVSVQGDWSIPYVHEFAGRWVGNWHWADIGFDQTGRVAVSRK